MSRAQQGAIESSETASSANTTQSAEKSQEQQQQDINNETSQLAKFSANNPYVSGGDLQTTQNQSIANSADASAQAAKAQMQQQAERTGQNPAAANASASSLAQANERAAATQEAGANAERVGSEAGYNEKALNAGQAIEGQQAGLTSNLTGEAQGQEGTAEQAANTPSFLDELGSGLIQAGVAATPKIPTGCWVAAELFGGWTDPRTVLVRAYLFGPALDLKIGRAFASFYLAYGERWAVHIRGNRCMRWITSRIFDRILAVAQRAEENQ